MSNNQIKFTASVVLYNTSAEMLKRLLASIKNSHIIDIVYLVDNSPMISDYDFSDDNTVSYLWANKNLGYGAGHNIALRLAIQSGADFHFVLNPDIYFEPQELQKMIMRMNDDASIGQLMPKVIYPDGSLQYLCKLIPTPFDLFIRRFLCGQLKEFARKNAERYELRFTGYNKEMNIPCLSGCFMLFRTSALRTIGLFDERFFMYTEDFDISRRMHVKYKTLFSPGVTVIHEHAKESYKSKKMLFIHIVSVIRYFNKWGWFFDAERKKVNAHTLELLRRNHNAD
jgi:GT2 family glycosyltransferase